MSEAATEMPPNERHRNVRLGRRGAAAVELVSCPVCHVPVGTCCLRGGQRGCHLDRIDKAQARLFAIEYEKNANRSRTDRQAFEAAKAAGRVFKPKPRPKLPEYPVRANPERWSYPPDMDATDMERPPWT